MKKFLTAFLFACTCALTGAAFAGCDDEATPVVPTPPPTPTESREVTFEEGEGYTIKANVTDGGELPVGSQLAFRVELGAFYAGSPVAYINDEVIQAGADGVFNYLIGEEDINVRIGQVHKDVSNMSGSGAFDDAFVVTKPIDLIKIAERVNAGDSRYVQGCYVLENDIDCKGEALNIIGDRSTDYSYFSGSFVCSNNADTGAYERHTISNFVINTNDVNYVGLFGTVFADISVSSSGLFYGVSLDNFTINATSSGLEAGNKSVAIGSLIGYGVGVKTFLCDATNGEINFNSDSSYFSYAGGLIGFQQGYYDANYDAYYPAEIAYANVDVDVNVYDGVTLTAGGIVGYMTTNYPYGATASVHNSYSSGMVNGALRSGGIAGGMGQYAVVSNCYSVSDVSAISSQLDGSIYASSPEYAHAYAGGLVGFAENDSIVHDSFFNGSVNAWATSGSNFEHALPIVGGGYEAGDVSVSSQKYVALNCEFDVDLSTTTYLTEKLGWQAYDWVFTKNQLPVINYGSPSGRVTLTMTINYVGASINQSSSKVVTYFNTSIQSLSSYHPLGSFMDTEGGLSSYYTADNGELSYGYFFDEACTQRVPLSYLPEKNITLYVGFADPTPIVNEGKAYQLYAKNTTKPLTMTFNADGIVTYTDGTAEQISLYSFDGANVLLEQVRLARYFDGAIVVDENSMVEVDPNFDASRYAFCDFTGVLDKANGTLSLYDGKYFTAENPLLAKSGEAQYRGTYYVKDSSGNVTEYALYGVSATVTTDNGGIKTTKTYASMSVDGDTITLDDVKNGALTVDGTTLKSYDAFYGKWAKSANINKFFIFDGMGGWTYEYVNYTRTWSAGMVSCTPEIVDKLSGTYELDTEDTIILKSANGDKYATADVKNGYLTITLEGETNEQRYHAEMGYVGSWKGFNYSLRLDGLTNKGQGTARITDADGYYTDLLYEVSETTNYITLYYTTVVSGVTYKSSLFGYASYVLASNTLELVTEDVTMQNSFVRETLFLYDAYYGEWISDFESFENVEFVFNGLGLYSYLAIDGFNGKLTIFVNGEEKVVDYTVTSDLTGSFTYGQQYDIAFDEDNNRVLISLSASTTLERKDELANIVFVDLDGNSYEFDGKSTLSVGGTVKVNGDFTYTYFADDEVEGKYNLIDGANGTVGSFTLPATDANHFLWTVGSVSKEIYYSNEFIGDWAILDQYALFKIGPTDTNGLIKANFKGSDVTLSYLTQDILTFYYREDKQPFTYYVFVRYDELWDRDVLVLSEFTSLLGEYYICSKVNDLYGTWEWKGDEGKTTLKFDGVSTGYANGCAVLQLQLDHITVTTPYLYVIRGDRMLMWSQSPMAGRTMYYRLDFLSEEEYEKTDDVYLLYDDEGNISKAIRLTEVNGLYLVEAVDEEGAKYFFDFIDGKNTVVVDGVAKYTYVVTAFNSDSTATVKVTDTDGVTYWATVDYSGTTTKFILGEVVAEESEGETTPEA